MKLTNRDKIGHLYRRFGLGATQKDLDEGEKLGPDKVLEQLIDYDKVDEGFDVSPHEFVWRMKDGVEDVDLNSRNYRAWWMLRLMATKRPLQEKLTLFWHNHFAVSDAKVEDGPMMLQYVDVLRKGANGKFGTLLTSVSKNPAMMRFLDMNRAIKGHPNENFAREVMELFTLGIGNYTEKDVQEVSRALTGWGFISIYNDRRGTPVEKLKEAIVYDRPFTSFCYMPDMHDTTPKTILGKMGNWDGDGVLDMLANHPVTAKRMCIKLWEFFAYENPEPAVIDRLTHVWTASQGDIKKVLTAIAKSKEFWSEKAYRTMVKSPIDLTVSMARQMGVGEALMALRPPNSPATSIAPNKMQQVAYAVAQSAGRMGLALMFPPDVSGWRWHSAWVSPAMMLERERYRGALLYERGVDSGGKAVYEFVKAKSPADARQAAEALLAFFDLALPEPSKAVVADAFEKAGGTKALANAGTFMQAYDKVMRIVLSAPEAQFC